MFQKVVFTLSETNKRGLSDFHDDLLTDLIEIVGNGQVNAHYVESSIFKVDEEPQYIDGLEYTIYYQEQGEDPEKTPVLNSIEDRVLEAKNEIGQKEIFFYTRSPRGCYFL